MIAKYLTFIIILVIPLQGFCMSDQEVFDLLMQHSTTAKMPIHVYVAPINENKDWDYGPFQGIPLPFASYSYFKKYYGQLENAERPEELFAISQFLQGTRWHCFLLRVPGMYSIDQIDLWVYDKEKKQWLLPFKIAEEGGDVGEAIDIQGWITDINEDGFLDIVRRTLEIDMHLDDSQSHTTNKYKNEVFVWAEGCFKDVSQEYANKLELNKYRFKKSIVNAIN